MGQSKFLWIIVYEDGGTEKPTCTWEELLNKLDPSREVFSIVRGNLA